MTDQFAPSLSFFSEPRAEFKKNQWIVYDEFRIIFTSSKNR